MRTNLAFFAISDLYLVLMHRKLSDTDTLLLIKRDRHAVNSEDTYRGDRCTSLRKAAGLLRKKSSRSPSKVIQEWKSTHSRFIGDGCPPSVGLHKNDDQQDCKTYAD